MEIKIQQEQLLPSLDTKRERREGLFFLHAFSVRRKSIDIPVAGRGEVELPVLRRILGGEKDFQTRFFPEPVRSEGPVSRIGDD